MAADGRHEALAVVLVGLPGRGKSYIGQKIMYLFRWLGYSSAVFSVSNYRRAKVGGFQDSSYFESNEANDALRQSISAWALHDMLEFFLEGGDIAVFDACNESKATRQNIRAVLAEHPNISVVFLEAIVEEPSIVDRNIAAIIATSPDFVKHRQDMSAARRDYERKFEFFSASYETIDADCPRFIKIIDEGRKLIINQANGFCMGRLVSYLMNFHTKPRKIYMSRHGQSEYNVLKLLGGDSPLTAKGRQYAAGLGDWMLQNADMDSVTVYTSRLIRTRETASYVKGKNGMPVIIEKWAELNEINAGDCEGMTYEEIEEKMPAEFEARKRDKLCYRYPNGESYQDLVVRLTPVIMEIERMETDLLIVAHQAILRVIYAYLMNIPPIGCPELNIPLHTVIVVQPRPYAPIEERFFIGP